LGRKRATNKQIQSLQSNCQYQETFRNPQTEETESGYTFKLKQVKKGIEQEGLLSCHQLLAEGSNVSKFLSL